MPTQGCSLAEDKSSLSRSVRRAIWPLPFITFPSLPSPKPAHCPAQLFRSDRHSSPTSNAGSILAGVTSASNQATAIHATLEYGGQAAKYLRERTHATGPQVPPASLPNWERRGTSVVRNISSSDVEAEIRHDARASGLHSGPIRDLTSVSLSVPAAPVKHLDSVY